MNRLLSLLFAFLVLTLAGCTKKPSGVYKLVGYDRDDEANMVRKLDFKDDGTCAMIVPAREPLPMTWKQEGTTVTIFNNGQPTSKLKLEGGDLVDTRVEQGRKFGRYIKE